MGSETTHFHYNLAGQLICETDGSGNAIRDYVYLSGEPVAMQLYGDDAGWYYFVNDHLGTPQKVVNNAGSVVWEAGYRLLIADIENNLRFPGQYFDAEIGLHYNWHRYYDPELGRYITADPIGLTGGMNLYAYVQNDPINWIDPEGLMTGVEETFPIVITYPELAPILLPLVPIAIVLYPSEIGPEPDVSQPAQMAAPGNQADTLITQKYGEYASEEKLNCRPPKDRCDWLNENQHLFNKAAVKATQKAWRCRGSRVKKDKKR